MAVQNPKNIEEAIAERNELKKGCEAMEILLASKRGKYDERQTALFTERDNIQKNLKQAKSEEEKTKHQRELYANKKTLDQHAKTKGEEHMTAAELTAYNTSLQNGQETISEELQNKKDEYDAAIKEANDFLADHDKATDAKQKLQDYNDKGYRTESQGLDATEAEQTWLAYLSDSLSFFGPTTKLKNLSKIAKLEEMHKALEGSDLHKNALTKTSDAGDKKSAVYQHITNLQVLYKEIQAEHTNSELSADDKAVGLKKYDSELAAMKQAYINMLVNGDSLSQNEEILMMCYLGGGSDEKQQHTALKDLTKDLKKALEADHKTPDDTKKLIKEVKAGHKGCFVGGERHMIGGQPANVTGDDLKQIVDEINAAHPRTFLERALCRPAAAKIVKDKDGIVTIGVRNKYRSDLMEKMETAHERNNKKKETETTKQEVTETGLGSGALGEAGIEEDDNSAYDYSDDDTNIFDESDEEDEDSDDDTDYDTDEDDYTESWQKAAGGANQGSDDNDTGNEPGIELTSTRDHRRAGPGLG